MTGIVKIGGRAVDDRVVHPVVAVAVSHRVESRMAIVSTAVEVCVVRQSVDKPKFKMRYVDQAAILLMSLGEADAAEILKHMGPTSQRYQHN